MPLTSVNLGVKVGQNTQLPNTQNGADAYSRSYNIS